MFYLINPNNINTVAKARRFGFSETTSQSILYVRRRSFWLRYGKKFPVVPNSWQRWQQQRKRG